MNKTAHGTIIKVETVHGWVTRLTFKAKSGAVYTTDIWGKAEVGQTVSASIYRKMGVR